MEQSDNNEKFSRSELLRKGLTGLTLLSVGPAVISCKGGERLVIHDATEGFDARLIHYRDTGQIPTGFHWARGIAAADSEEFWVAGDMEVKRLDSFGKAVETLTMPGTAKSVAIGPGGIVYAATDDQIVTFDKGKKAAWDSLGPRSRIVKLTVGSDSVYAADAGNRVVLRFGFDGKIRTRIGEGKLIVPSPYLGLAVNTKGEVLVSNPGRHAVQRFSSDGQLLGSFGKRSQDIDGFCGCCNPTNLAILANGDIVTSEKGLPRIKVFSPSGDLRCVVAGPKDFDPQTAGLDLALVGTRILVLDPWRSAVRPFEPI